MTTATETLDFRLYSSDTPLETLVAAAQQGDRDAFGQLVERYEGMVKSVALRRLGDEAEALELAQDVFMKAMQRIDQLKEPAAIDLVFLDLLERQVQLPGDIGL